MSEQTANLSLPYIMAAQAQKHVTHNEALRALDAIVQIGVERKDLTIPPSTPEEGARYIVPTGAVDAWSDKQDHIAAWQDGAWSFFVPNTGWLAWVAYEELLLVFDDGAWVSIERSNRFGINADADDTNRLSVNSDAVLFNHNGDSNRVKINKAATSDTASLLFQDGFSGRAEVGLVGNDDFSFMVSDDGATFARGIVISAATGNVSLGSVADTRDDVVIRSASNTALRLVTDAEDNVTLGFHDLQAYDTQNFEIKFDAAPNNGMSFNFNNSAKQHFFNSDGNVEINGHLSTGGNDLYLKSGALVSADPYGQFSDRSSGNIDHIYHDDSINTWHFCSDTTYKSNGNSTLRASAFSTTSDYRLKKNVVDVGGVSALSTVMALRPVTYEWKESGTDDFGFIAHELQKIVPGAVFGEKDGVGPDGSPIYQAVDLAKLVPILAAAICELSLRLKP